MKQKEKQMHHKNVTENNDNFLKSNKRITVEKVPQIQMREITRESQNNNMRKINNGSVSLMKPRLDDIWDNTSNDNDYIQVFKDAI